MHETLTQQSDKKGKLKCTRHQHNNQTERKTKMHETLTQQSDKKENQNARDTNATIRQKGKPKRKRH